MTSGGVPGPDPAVRPHRMEGPWPEYIQLYPTLRCTQRCHFCFNPRHGAAGERDMAFRDALRLLDILSDNGICEIDIMGGEPFLLPWIVEFLDAIRARNMTVNISTNGSLPDALRPLAGLRDRRFNIGVSLEGSTPDRHYSLTGSRNFDSALESIRFLVSLGIDPIVKTVLMRSSVEDMEQVISLVRTIGVKRYFIIHLDCMSHDRRMRDEALSYPEFVRHFSAVQHAGRDMTIGAVHASCFDNRSLPHSARCAGGVRKVAVMPEGSVYPCNLLTHFDGYRLGNIFEDEFSSIWSSPVCHQFRNGSGNPCREQSCPYRTACTGGCPAHGLLHYGTPGAPDIRCRPMRP